jgi:hypothetical protein
VADSAAVKFVVEGDFGSGSVVDAESPASGHLAVKFSCQPAAVELTMAGTGGLTATLNIDGDIATQMDGVGDLIPTINSIYAVSTTMDGTGDLAATLSAIYTVATTMAGVGDLTSTLNGTFVIAVTMDGQGTLVIPYLVGDMVLEALFSGTGDLVPALSGDFTMLLVMDGNGNLRAYLKKPIDFLPSVGVADRDVWSVW